MWPRTQVNLQTLISLPSCNSLQTVRGGLANNANFEPTIAANMRGHEPTLTANQLRFIATSSQTAMGTQIQCIRDLEDLNIPEKSGP
jgi:hypothetical protein